jgi:hypothetical protein
MQEQYNNLLNNRALVGHVQNNKNKNQLSSLTTFAV